jgi:hypothetical protein
MLDDKHYLSNFEVYISLTQKPVLLILPPIRSGDLSNRQWNDKVEPFRYRIS